MIDGDFQIRKVEATHENNGFEVHVGSALRLMSAKIHTLQFHGVFRTAGGGTDGKQDG